MISLEDKKTDKLPEGFVGLPELAGRFTHNDRGSWDGCQAPGITPEDVLRNHKNFLKAAEKDVVYRKEGACRIPVGVRYPYKRDLCGYFGKQEEGRSLRYTIVAQNGATWTVMASRVFFFDSDADIKKYCTNKKKYKLRYLCGNYGCFTKDHVVFESLKEIETRKLCSGPPSCTHTPKCMDTGEKYFLL
jgi:hypothetical protein